MSHDLQTSNKQLWLQWFHDVDGGAPSRSSDPNSNKESRRSRSAWQIAEKKHAASWGIRCFLSTKAVGERLFTCHFRGNFLRRILQHSPIPSNSVAFFLRLNDEKFYHFCLVSQMMHHHALWITKCWMRTLVLTIVYSNMQHNHPPPLSQHLGPVATTPDLLSSRVSYP